MHRLRPTKLAFTIVEVLLSITILSGMVIMLVNMFDQVSRTWNVTERQIESRRTLRAVAESIAADVRFALQPVAPPTAVNSPNTATLTNLQFLLNPPHLSQKIMQPDCIFFQAPVATESTYGEIAEVGYFVRWVDTTDDVPEAARSRTPSFPVPRLCRFFVNPSTKTITEGVASVVPNPNFKIYSDPVWLDDVLIQRVAPAVGESPADGAPGGYVGLLADNVFALWVRAYTIDNRLLPVSNQQAPFTYDSRKGYEYFEAFKQQTGSGTQKRLGFLPKKLIISLAMVDPRQVEQLGRQKTRIEEMVRSVRNSAPDPNTPADAIERDVTLFEQALREAADSSAEMRALLPAIKTYCTEVYLDNSL